MANRNRPVQVIFRCTPEERAMIDKDLLLGDLMMAVIDPRISFVKKEGAR